MSFIRKYLAFAVGLPILIAATAAVVANLIPGCTIDTGIGASGCGDFGYLLALAEYGGACVALLGLVGFIPVLIGYLALGKK